MAEDFSAAFDDVFFVNVALIIIVAYLAGLLPLSMLCCQLFTYSVVLTKHAIDLQMFKIEGSSSKFTKRLSVLNSVARGWVWCIRM